MEIKTKFDIGDTVYLMRNNIIVKTIVTRIKIISDDGILPIYSLKSIILDDYDRPIEDTTENNLFESPEKLTKELIKRHKELFK